MRRVLTQVCVCVCVCVWKGRLVSYRIFTSCQQHRVTSGRWGVCVERVECTRFDTLILWTLELWHNVFPQTSSFFYPHAMYSSGGPIRGKGKSNIEHLANKLRQEKSTKKKHRRMKTPYPFQVMQNSIKITSCKNPSLSLSRSLVGALSNEKKKIEIFFPCNLFWQPYPSPPPPPPTHPLLRQC